MEKLLLKGGRYVLHLLGNEVPCVVTELYSIIDGKQNPRFVKRNQKAHVKIILDSPICLERYQDYRTFGRFVLRKGTSTELSGVIL